MQYYTKRSAKGKGKQIVEFYNLKYLSSGLTGSRNNNFPE